MAQKNLLQSAGDGTAIPAGAVGEVKFLGTTTNTATQTVAGNQLTLSAGIWIVSAQCDISGTGPTKARLDIELVSGGTWLGINYQIQSYAGGDGATIARLNCGGGAISVSSSANIRSVVYQTVAASSSVAQYIQAIRIA